jgi:hypothetical protein
LEAAATPFGLVRDHVARRAGDGSDAGAARTRDPVEHSGLSDIRSADEHYG